MISKPCFMCTCLLYSSYTRFLYTSLSSFSLIVSDHLCQNLFNDSALLCRDLMGINKEGIVSQGGGGVSRIINQAESELVAEDLLHKSTRHFAYLPFVLYLRPGFRPEIRETNPCFLLSFRSPLLSTAPCCFHPASNGN